MNRCKFCRMILLPEETVCPHCGHPMSPELSFGGTVIAVIVAAVLFWVIHSTIARI